MARFENYMIDVAPQLETVEDAFPVFSGQDPQEILQIYRVREFINAGMGSNCHMAATVDRDRRG
jgi:hypothetical protein